MEAAGDHECRTTRPQCLPLQHRRTETAVAMDSDEELLSKVTAWAGVDFLPPRGHDESRHGWPEVVYSLRQVGQLLKAWTDVPESLDWLLECSSTSPETGAGVVPGTLPGRGLITDHPIFCALWAQPTEAYEAVGRQGQAVLICALAEIIAAGRKLGEFESAIRNAGLSVRRIGHGQFLPSSLTEPLQNARSLKDVHAALHNGSRAELIAEAEARLVAGLGVLVKDAVDGRSARKRQVGVRVIRALRSSRRAEFDDPTPPFREYQEGGDGQPTKEDQAEGAAPCAENPVRRMITVRVEHGGATLSPGQLLYRAAFRSRAIATSAQALLLGSDRLHLVDIEAAEAASMLIRGKRGADELRRGQLAAAASFVTGRPIEVAAALRVVRSVADIDRGHPLSIAVDDSMLSLPVPKPAKSFTAKPEDAGLYRSVEHRLVVALPTDLEWASTLLEYARRRIGNVLFEGDEWKRHAEAFIAFANEKFAARLTLTRIANFLHRQALAVSRDHADAEILAGRDASARRHYYAPARAKLEGLYEQVWIGVRRGVGKPGGSTSESVPELSFPEKLAEPPGPYIGSESCPTDAAVKAMVEDLIATTRGQLRGRRSDARNRIVHNALAVYTIVMILWHTGIRAVHDPVELDLYDPYTGLLGVSDKDSDAYSSSRVVALPHIVQQQIAAYRDHLGALGEVVPADKSNAFFLWDTDARAHEVTPKRLTELLPASFRFRMNSQRHYLRTRLVELEAEPQVVDAFMGHADAGQEAHGRYSCLSPERLKLEIVPRLDCLSRIAGWVRLRGVRE